MFVLQSEMHGNYQWITIYRVTRFKLIAVAQILRLLGTSLEHGRG